MIMTPAAVRKEVKEFTRKGLDEVTRAYFLVQEFDGVYEVSLTVEVDRWSNNEMEIIVGEFDNEEAAAGKARRMTIQLPELEATWEVSNC